jgi:hypothetical protein
MKYGYAIKLRKKDFLSQIEKDFQPQQLFYLPPIPTIVQLASIGEFFHPRSKVYIDPHLRNSTELFIGGIMNCTARRLPDFLLTDFESVKHFSKFVKEKVVVIKES